jgi:hypothetical protein
MRTTPGLEELEDPSLYEKVLTLQYTEIAPFVLKQVKNSPFPVTAIWIMAAFSIFLSAWFWPGLRYPAAGQPVIAGLAAGMLFLPLLLVPVHEGLHLIPFRIAGARDIRVGADLRQGIIYVAAHRFVARRRLFTAVALAPLILISAGLSVMMLLSPFWWKWVFSMTLFVHTTMCAGDMALLGFLYGFRGREVYTWDDADRREAYFYVEVNTSPGG